MDYLRELSCNSGVISVSMKSNWSIICFGFSRTNYNPLSLSPCAIRVKVDDPEGCPSFSQTGQPRICIKWRFP